MKTISALILCFCSTFLYSQHNTASSFHQGPQLTGIYSSMDHLSFGSVLMKFRTGGKIFSSPIYDNGIVYIGSGDASLYAVDTKNKKLKWRFPTGGAVNSTPALFDGLIYFGSYDGYFYALDAMSGKLKWKFKTDGEKRVGAKGLWTMKPATEFMEDPYDFFLSSPVIDAKEGIVYFGSGDGSVYALHAGNGNLLWRFRTGGIVHSSPALYDGLVYIGSWDRNLYALDGKTGKEKWRFTTGADSVQHLLEGIQASPSVYNGTVFCGSRDGYFYAVDPGTGALKWKYPANNSWILTTPAFRNNTVYIGTSDTYQFLALDAETGKEKFKVQANGYVYSSPAISGNRAYFGDFTGQLFAIDLDNDGAIAGKFATEERKSNAGKILLNDKIDFTKAANGLDLSLYSSTVAGMNRLYTLGPILSSPFISGDTIYFADATGYLYALSLTGMKN